MTQLSILKLRRDFLAANRGRRVATPGFVLLVHPRADVSAAMRVGFTVTKKIGNAVVRNRMKRRLRALARELLPAGGTAGADHVLIGRSDGVEREFATLRAEMTAALVKAGRANPPPQGEGDRVAVEGPRAKRATSASAAPPPPAGRGGRSPSPCRGGAR